MTPAQVRTIAISAARTTIMQNVLTPVIYRNNTDVDSTSDVTMVPIPDLTIPVAADSAYVIEYFLIYSSTLAGNSIYYDYTAPADADVVWDEGKPYPSSDLAATDYFAQVRMIVNTNDDAGEVVLRFRTFADTETMTIRVGSMAVVNGLISIRYPDEDLTP